MENHIIENIFYTCFSHREKRSLSVCERIHTRYTQTRTDTHTFIYVPPAGPVWHPTHPPTEKVRERENEREGDRDSDRDRDIS
jgi:hypothetical protein